MFLLTSFGKGAIARSGGLDSRRACTRSAGRLSYRVRIFVGGLFSTGEHVKNCVAGNKSYLPSCRRHSLRQVPRGRLGLDLPRSAVLRPSGGSQKIYGPRGEKPAQCSGFSRACRNPNGNATPLPFPREPAGGAKVELCVRSSCLASRPASRRKLGLPSGSPSVSRGFCVSGPFWYGRGKGRAGQYDGT